MNKRSAQAYATRAVPKHSNKKKACQRRGAQQSVGAISASPTAQMSVSTTLVATKIQMFELFMVEGLPVTTRYQGGSDRNA